MTYEEAKTYLSSASKIYVNVTNDEVYNCPVEHWFTVVNGINLLGTTQEYSGLTEKEVIPVKQPT